MSKKSYNIQFGFGVILLICHFLMWLIPGILLGMGNPKNYYFISIFPLWFILSAFGTFFVVISMIIIFVFFFRKDIQ
ncbi:DUF997 family protein [Rickettsiales bacterium LUAb2]